MKALLFMSVLLFLLVEIAAGSSRNLAVFPRPLIPDSFAFTGYGIDAGASCCPVYHGNSTGLDGCWLVATDTGSAFWNMSISSTGAVRGLTEYRRSCFEPSSQYDAASGKLSVAVFLYGCTSYVSLQRESENRFTGTATTCSRVQPTNLTREPASSLCGC